ncbi:uncharacterized protein LOC120013671 [Tripterygium wilfordii]|nr:uncharacterized protein LOC120013671 [Tripterygium wilfordii]
MGQAFRRATGRIRPSGGTIDRQPPARPTESKVEISRRSRESVALDRDGTPEINADNNLEERDPKFDAMLSQMVGRISSKPGGKSEIGEASVVERYNRPMPKLRNTKPDSARFEERPTPPGTLNVAQLRQIMLLYQGKADDHNGPIDAHQIAAKFRVELTQVQRILQFLSLPPEDTNKKKSYE